MKISVAIPVYNEEKYIAECLTALTIQERPPDEIIIVDNNSTDNTMNIVKNFPVTIVQEKTQGMTYARNKGFDVATGDVIARCDADTIPPPYWIKKIEADFIQHRIDAVSGPINLYDLPFPTVFLSTLFVFSVGMTQQGKKVMLGPNMAIKKELWHQIRSIVCMDNNKVHEDIDLSVHINRMGGKILFDSTLIVKSSGRRIRNHPYSFFIEYPHRLITTLQQH